MEETGGDKSLNCFVKSIFVSNHYLITINIALSLSSIIFFQQTTNGLGPDNSIRPQAIGQSSDEQETASENDKTDTSIVDADSASDEPAGKYYILCCG